MGRLPCDLSHVGHELPVILALWTKGLGGASYPGLSLMCDIVRLVLIQSSSSNL